MTTNTEQETPDVISEIYDIYSQIHYEELSDDEFKDAILTLIEAEATRRCEALLDRLEYTAEVIDYADFGNDIATNYKVIPFGAIEEERRELRGEK